MKDEIKEIEEWLRDISTPTGLSYSGDRTLSNSMVDHIIDYITNLQERFNALLEAHKIADELETKYQEENERLNNIINELEKWLNDNENLLIHYDYESKYEYIYVDELLDKLKALKEGKE